MDTTTVIVIVVLVAVLGIFFGTQITGKATSGDNAISGISPPSQQAYPTQLGGGACGR